MFVRHALGTPPPWILNWGELESSGQRLVSSFGKTKGIAFLSPAKKKKKILGGAGILVERSLCSGCEKTKVCTLLRGASEVMTKQLYSEKKMLSTLGNIVFTDNIFANSMSSFELANAKKTLKTLILRGPYPKLWRHIPILPSTSVTMKLCNLETLGLCSCVTV